MLQHLLGLEGADGGETVQGRRQLREHWRPRDSFQPLDVAGRRHVELAQEHEQRPEEHRGQHHPGTDEGYHGHDAHDVQGDLHKIGF